MEKSGRRGCKARDDLFGHWHQQRRAGISEGVYIRNPI
jgi:hypothetical protein